MVNFYDLFLVEIYRNIQSQFLFVMFKLCTNKNHWYKHNEQINNQNINNSECFGVKFVKNLSRNDFTIIFGNNMVLVDHIGLFLHVAILLATYGRPIRLEFYL